MEPNLEGVRRHAEMLPDDALLEVKREDLTEAAQAIYEAELKRRGLAWPEETIVDEEAAAAEAAEQGGGLVSLGKYDSLEEGRFARDLLRNEQIPCWFAGELQIRKADADPLAALELLTPATFVEQAKQLLNSEISDEELARQAEAAAGEYQEEKEEEEEEEAR